MNPLEKNNQVLIVPNVNYNTDQKKIPSVERGIIEIAKETFLFLGECLLSPFRTLLNYTIILLNGINEGIANIVNDVWMSVFDKKTEYPSKDLGACKAIEDQPQLALAPNVTNANIELSPVLNTIDNQTQNIVPKQISPHDGIDFESENFKDCLQSLKDLVDETKDFNIQNQYRSIKITENPTKNTQIHQNNWKAVEKWHELTYHVNETIAILEQWETLSDHPDEIKQLKELKEKYVSIQESWKKTLLNPPNDFSNTVISELASLETSHKATVLHYVDIIKLADFYRAQGIKIDLSIFNIQLSKQEASKIHDSDTMANSVYDHGFYNPKYNCYMNASLAMLLYSKGFRKILNKLSLSEKTEAEPNEKTGEVKLITKQMMLNLLKILKKPPHKDNTLFPWNFFNPSQNEKLINKELGIELLRFNAAIQGLFPPHLMHDVPEFIDLLYNELNLEKIKQTTTLTYTLENNDEIRKPKASEDSLLKINLTSEKTDLQTLINNYFKPIQNKNDDIFVHYKENDEIELIQKYENTTTITQLPDMVTVQLLRFGYTGKLETPVQWPKNDIIKLPITKIDHNNQEITIYEEYKIVGFVEHGGGLSGGHYWSYTKDSDNRWTLHNDERVQQVSEAEIEAHKPNAYVLLLEKNKKPANVSQVQAITQ